jgi:Flp pilus assembly protein TadG
MLPKKVTSVLALAILLVTGSCKKTVDNIKEDLMIKLITENTWKIVKYAEGSSNQTTVYTDYDFKFNKDGSLNAIKNGVTEATGTWAGSEATQSITAEFPSATEPLAKLTGVWLISNTKSKPWRVYSHRSDGSKEYLLDLQEK